MKSAANLPTKNSTLNSNRTDPEVQGTNASSTGVNFNTNYSNNNREASNTEFVVTLKSTEDTTELST